MVWVCLVSEIITATSDIEKPCHSCSRFWTPWLHIKPIRDKTKEQKWVSLTWLNVKFGMREGGGRHVTRVTKAPDDHACNHYVPDSGLLSIGDVCGIHEVRWFVFVPHHLVFMQKRGKNSVSTKKTLCLQKNITLETKDFIRYLRTPTRKRKLINNPSIFDFRVKKKEQP